MVQFDELFEQMLNLIREDAESLDCGTEAGTQEPFSHVAPAHIGR